MSCVLVELAPVWIFCRGVDSIPPLVPRILLKALHTSLLEFRRDLNTSSPSQSVLGTCFPPGSPCTIPTSPFENSSLAVTFEQQFMESDYVGDILLLRTEL